MARQLLVRTSDGITSNGACEVVVKLCCMKINSIAVDKKDQLHSLQSIPVCESTNVNPSGGSTVSKSRLLQFIDQVKYKDHGVPHADKPWATPPTTPCAPTENPYDLKQVVTRPYCTVPFPRSLTSVRLRPELLYPLCYTHADYRQTPRPRAWVSTDLGTPIPYCSMGFHQGLGDQPIIQRERV